MMLTVSRYSRGLIDVFAVDGEVVAKRDPAARPDRQAGHVIVLREIAADAERLERGRDLRAGDGEAADLPRRREIALHQRRRHAQHGRVVVEPVRLFVGRQQRRDVDVEIEQVANGVAVLGSIQPMHRRRRSVGDASAALSIVVSRCATSASSAACAGRGMPDGGIMPARTFRMTFSHTSAPAGMFASRSVSSTSPPVFARSL